MAPAESIHHRPRRSQQHITAAHHFITANITYHHPNSRPVGHSSHIDNHRTPSNDNTWNLHILSPMLTVYLYLPTISLLIILYIRCLPVAQSNALSSICPLPTCIFAHLPLSQFLPSDCSHHIYPRIACPLPLVLQIGDPRRPARR